MAKITKLKSGKYRIQVYDEYGKRYRNVFQDKASAKAFITKIEMNKYKSKLVKLNLIEPDYSFETAIAEFVESKQGLRKKSIQKYNGVVNELNNFLNTQRIKNLNEFNRNYADLFRRKLVESGASPKTINFYLSTVKSIFNDQVNKDKLAKNPFSHIKRVRAKVKTLKDRENEYYTSDELVQFFNKAKRTVYYYPFVGLYLTGCRFEELSTLQWKSVDFENRVIKIRCDEQFTTKTISSERDIPISNYLHKVLIELRKISKSNYVFSSIKNEKLSERTLLARCKVIAKAAGISKNTTLHKFRHTFSSLLAQKKVNLEIRQYLLGHKPQNMTSHYTKLDVGKFHNEVNLLDDVFNKIDLNEGENKNE